MANRCLTTLVTAKLIPRVKQTYSDTQFRPLVHSRNRLPPMRLFTRQHGLDDRSRRPNALSAYPAEAGELEMGYCPVMSPRRLARTLIVSSVGLLPAWEWRNRVVASRATWKNLRFQRQEIKRLRDQFEEQPRRARVAVVIPTFQRPEQLLVAVDSALTQSFKDVIVVVVDDGGGSHVKNFVYVMKSTRCESEGVRTTFLV